MVPDESCDRFDVVVAGAGPVGLMLACELRLGGVSVLVLERSPEPERMTKAGSIGPLGFEALARRGLLGVVLEAERRTLQGYREMALAAGRAPEDGLPKEHFAGLEKLDGTQAGDADRRRVRVEQPALVDILLRRAGQLGVQLRRSHEVVEVDHEHEAIRVLARTPSGTSRVLARYVVGCDGASSAVRSLAGFELTGTPPTLTGRQGVVEFAGASPVPHGFHYTPDGLIVYGLGVDRVATVEFDGPPDPSWPPLDERELERSIHRVSGIEVEIAAMRSGGRFTDHAYQATNYRRGRVLLAGDAAHCHAPFGGQGLNVGLTDAANLGWKLAAELQGWAPAGLLDSYHAERHPVGVELLRNARAQAALMRPDPQSTALRKLFEKLLDIDAVKGFVADRLGGLDTRYDLGDSHPLAGTLYPNIRVFPVEETGQLGCVRTLANLPPDPRGLLLDFANRTELRTVVDRWSRRVRILTCKSEQKEADALLLRPDGCVAWVLLAGAALEQDDLMLALRTWFGRPE
ncbi:FAD-dependent oxidoreductase [Longimycelium tulufanense]|uniref:FAD-dependent oxidoreductase n=1 Tax=Longimycelium tulufanense TaxID=907463 RepID=A0A8J3CDT5_9PSEU|nr:FAD-dependent monooxygenase [Longimycelium tulufanense]GGM52763.1 FAD-dependent oxidoreductase [Longimycelium tulufanense]